MQNQKLRLDKIIADSGLYTRSDAKALIRAGRVIVDGSEARDGGLKLDPDTAAITIDGMPVSYKEYRYIMLNKPADYVSATDDRNEATVMELLDDKYAKLGVFPVGRLDKDCEGLLLLTNDGTFAHKVTSPGSKVYKRYFVKIDGTINAHDVEAFKRGMALGDGTKCRPALLEECLDIDAEGNDICGHDVCGRGATGCAYVTICEGKYHQVKRMLAALGKPVVYLKRVAIGGLTLDAGLSPGGYRELCVTGDELLAVIYSK